MSKILKFCKNAKGFTMLELMMVNIIIAVLASTAIPQYSDFIEKARSAEGTNMIGVLRRAEMLYKLENGAYTADLSQLSVTAVPVVGNPDPVCTYWTYGVAATAAGVEITATRTARKATVDQTGKTLICTYDDTTGAATWGGTYTAVIPK